MKNLALFSMLLLLAGLGGCEKKAECDYYDYFVVENKTDKQIVVSIKLNDGMTHSAEIVPDESERIYHMSALWPCGNNEPMRDYFEELQLIPYGEPFYDDSVEDEWGYKMTFDGEAVSRKIWLRKYWSFSSTADSRTWTLTVTEELLANPEL